MGTCRLKIDGEIEDREIDRKTHVRRSTGMHALRRQVDTGASVVGRLGASGSERGKEMNEGEIKNKRKKERKRR